MKKEYDFVYPDDKLLDRGAAILCIVDVLNLLLFGWFFIEARFIGTSVIGFENFHYLFWIMMFLNMTLGGYGAGQGGGNMGGGHSGRYTYYFKFRDKHEIRYNIFFIQYIISIFLTLFGLMASTPT